MLVAASEGVSQMVSGTASTAVMASETAHACHANVNNGKKSAQVAVQTVKSVYTYTTDLAGIFDQLNGKVLEKKSVVNVNKYSH